MNSKHHDPNNDENLTAHPKTTLKWGSDGELSAIDMARILDKLSSSELTECDLACNVDYKNKEQN